MLIALPAHVLKRDHLQAELGQTNPVTALDSFFL